MVMVINVSREEETDILMCLFYTKDAFLQFNNFRKTGRYRVFLNIDILQIGLAQCLHMKLTKMP